MFSSILLFWGIVFAQDINVTVPSDTDATMLIYCIDGKTKVKIDTPVVLDSDRAGYLNVSTSLNKTFEVGVSSEYSTMFFLEPKQFVSLLSKKKSFYIDVPAYNLGKVRYSFDLSDHKDSLTLFIDSCK